MWVFIPCSARNESCKKSLQLSTMAGINGTGLIDSLRFVVRSAILCETDTSGRPQGNIRPEKGLLPW